jgi:large subunit ribosomal protein L41
MWRNSILSIANRASSSTQLCTTTSSSSAVIRHQSTTIAVNNNSRSSSRMSLIAQRTNNNYFLSALSIFHESRRFMSKYLSKSATKRLPLTNKKVKKGYYKGNGATMEGRITSKGKFIADPMKKLQLIVPDLEGFKLKPYIANSVSKLPPELRAGDMK